MRSSHLWCEEPTEVKGKFSLQATFESAKGERYPFWYRVPLEHASSVSSSSADPFVRAAFFSAMSDGGRFHIHGQVSPSLLRNLEEFNGAWHRYYPDRYLRIESVADSEVEQPSTSGTRAIAGFSGGLDSCFTLFRHRRSLVGRREENLQTTMMVHGFDIPLEKPETFERAFEHSQAMVSDLGVPLIPVTTNFRILDQCWEHCHGAAITSVLSLFSKEHTTGLIASSGSYEESLKKWGSSPLTDWMFSSNAFRIVHDGADYGRLEKAQLVIQWPYALKHLRVCWEGEQQDRNCGHCEKCMRTLLAMKSLGIEHPECFPEEPSEQDIRSMVIKNRGLIHYWDEIVAQAEKSGIHAGWVRALETCIGRNRGVLRPLRLAAFALKKKGLNGTLDYIRANGGNLRSLLRR